MAEKAESSPAKRGPAFVAMLVIAALALYFFSTGPVILLMEKTNGFGGHVSWEALQKIYYPIEWLYDHTLLKKPIEWYLELWGAK